MNTKIEISKIIFKKLTMITLLFSMTLAIANCGNTINQRDKEKDSETNEGAFTGKASLAQADSPAVEGSGEVFSEDLIPIVFTGDQVNVSLQPLFNTAFSTYECYLLGQSSQATFRSVFHSTYGTVRKFDLASYTQVNCHLGIPANAHVIIEDALQINLEMILTDQPVHISSEATQINLRLAPHPLHTYYINATAVQVNLNGCAAFNVSQTPSAGAVELNFRAVQINVDCVSPINVDWELTRLYDLNFYYELGAQGVIIRDVGRLIGNIGSAIGHLGRDLGHSF